jgi:hypothetical protein
VCHEHRRSTRAVHNCTRDEGGPFEVGNQVLTSKRTHADEIEMIFPFGGQLTSPSDGVHIGPRFRLFG